MIFNVMFSTILYREFFLPVYFGFQVGEYFYSAFVLGKWLFVTPFISQYQP